MKAKQPEMSTAPKLGKCHSQKAADEFVRLGWTLVHEFFADGDAEPYEYLFEWRQSGVPVSPSRNSADWGKTP